MRIVLCALLLLAAGCNDAVTCDTLNAPVGDLCLPSPVSPDLTTAIEIREACGRGCTSAPTCTALFRNGQVVLDVAQEVCSDSLTANCLDQGCLRRVIHCALPGLPAGDYTLVVPGGPARSLHVAPGGSASCRFTTTDGGVQ